MSKKRAFAVSAITFGLIAANIAPFATAASAQPVPGHEGQRRDRIPVAKPAPQTQRSAAPMVRQQQYAARPAPRQFAPPPVRHAAPAPHHEAPRRGYGWRPWGYGAAVAGAVIVGSALVRSRPSDSEACANDFEAFDWDSGTIINRDGDRQLCPYLE